MPNGNKGRKKNQNQNRQRGSRNPSRGQLRSNRSTPAAYATTPQASRGPRIRTGGRTTTITHTELIADVDLTTTYTAVGYTINPSVTTTFPWLSSQATGWEYYRIRSMTFKFEPYVGTTTQGQIAMAIEYSAGSDPPATMSSILGYSGAVSGPAYRSLVCTFSPAAGHPAGKKYVRHSTQAPTERKLYDAGELYVATTNASAAGGAGILRVTYVVDFFTPQVEHTEPRPENTMAMGANAATPVWQTGTATSNLNTVPFGNTVLDSSDIKTSAMDDAGTLFTLPKGFWKVVSKIPYSSTLQFASAAIESVVAELMESADGKVASLQSLSPPVYGQVKRINIPTTGNERIYNTGFDNIIDVPYDGYGVTVAVDHVLNTSRSGGQGAFTVGRNISFERVE